MGGLELTAAGGKAKTNVPFRVATATYASRDLSAHQTLAVTQEGDTARQLRVGEEGDGRSQVGDRQAHEDLPGHGGLLQRERPS